MQNTAAFCHCWRRHTVSDAHPTRSWRQSTADVGARGGLDDGVG
jgi:hypothetical protein